MNFRKIKFKRAALCDTLSFIVHANKEFFRSEGSTMLENFCKGFCPFTRIAAALEAAPSRTLTNPTNGNEGYESPPLSIPAIRAVVVELDLGACIFIRQPSQQMLSWTALTRKPAISASVLARKL